MSDPRIRSGLVSLWVLGLACVHPPAAPVEAEQSEERRLAGADGWLLGSALGIGPALPVVFIHGVGGDHHFFDAQLRELRGGRRVAAFDQRGCGGSADSPRNVYDLDTRVGDLSAVLDVLRLDPVVLVGHGTGGQVVARYAERNPARVLGLVLIDPVSRNAEAARIAGLPDPELRPAVDAWLATLLGTARPETREKVLASARVARTPAVRAMLSDAGGSALESSLTAYSGPVLLLVSPDQGPPPGLRQGIAVRTFSASSHWSLLDVPEEVNAALKDFLHPLDGDGRWRK